jgi:thiol-disulfide isomerase/thioredoxin
LDSDVRLEIIPFLGLALLLGGCDRQSTPASQPKRNETVPPAAMATEGETAQIDRSQKGQPWPGYGFEAPNGDKVTLADFKGRPVLMNLWATWCGPCIKELPSLEAVAQREAEALQVLAISQDLDGRKTVDAWWKQQKFKLLQPYIDAKADFSFKLGGGGALPITVLYDAAGKEVWRAIGPMDWSSAKAKALIAEAA